LGVIRSELSGGSVQHGPDIKVIGGVGIILVNLKPVDVEKWPSTSNRVIGVVVAGMHNTTPPDFQQRECVMEGGVRLQRMVVGKSLAMPSRQELGKNDNDGVIVVIISFTSRPVQAFHRAVNSTGAGAGCGPLGLPPQQPVEVSGLSLVA